VGKYDSSKYRVRPLMRFIGKDSAKLEKLLRMVECDNIPSMPNIRVDSIFEAAFSDEDKKEKQLKPLPQHLDAMKELNRQGKLLKTPPGTSKLEGNTHPDIFVETDKYIIVVEAKWTEATSTTKTTYLKNRDQLIRHIEGAINYAPQKEVLAFYIVDEDDFLNNNQNNRTKLSLNGFISTLQSEPVQKPNLSKKIKSAYKGYTTWQKIEESFGKENLLFKTKEDVAMIKNNQQ
jgi:uncharacterized protein YciI